MADKKILTGINVDGNVFSNKLVSAYNGLEITPVAIEEVYDITTVNTTGLIENGVHYYYVSYYTSSGETGLRSPTTTNVTTDAANAQVDVTLPVSTDPRVIGRKVYRSGTDEAAYSDVLLVATIAENTSTLYTDNIPDASRTGAHSFWRENTTSSYITIGGEGVFMAGYGSREPSLIVGTGAGTSTFNGTATGGANTFLGTSVGRYITTGNKNVGIGYGALNSITGGYSNTAIGVLSLVDITSGVNNTAIGRNTGGDLSLGSNNILIGSSAGNIAGAGESRSGITSIGTFSGRKATADNNTFIGYSSGDSVSQSVTAADSLALGANSWTTKSYQYAYGSATTTEHLFRNGAVIAEGDISANNLSGTNTGDQDVSLGTLGAIGGSISDNRIAFGATTANEIEGDANLTWDGSDLNVVGSMTVDSILVGNDTTDESIVIKGQTGARYGVYTHQSLALYATSTAGASPALSFTYGDDNRGVVTGFRGVELTNYSSTLNTTHLHEVNSIYPLNGANIEQGFLAVFPKIAQTGTGNYIGFLLDATETTTGSGSNMLADFRLAGVSNFNVTNGGDTNILGTVNSNKLEVNTTIFSNQEQAIIHADTNTTGLVISKSETDTGLYNYNNLILRNYDTTEGNFAKFSFGNKIDNRSQASIMARFVNRGLSDGSADLIFMSRDAADEWALWLELKHTGFHEMLGSLTMTGDLTTNGVLLDVTPTVTTSTPGLIQWNSDDDTIDIHANGVTYQSGQELSPLYKNQTGSTITNGTPVMFTGTVGASSRLTIAPAIADGTKESFHIVGVTTQDIADAADGHVTWFGKVRLLDTSGTPYGETWADGDLLYVSAATAGYLTKTKPVAPNQAISVAAVILAHATTGSLFVRPSWTGTLSDLTDVNGTAHDTDGQFLVWDNTNGYFDATYNITDYALASSVVATDLAYTAATTNGIVTSSTGTNATLLLANTTNAGLLAPGDFDKLALLSGTNTGDNAINSLYSGLVSNVTTDLAYTASPTEGVVTSSDGTDATLTLATGTNAGLMTPAYFTNLASTSGSNTGDQTLTGLDYWNLTGGTTVTTPTITGAVTFAGATTVTDDLAVIGGTVTITETSSGAAFILDRTDGSRSMMQAGGGGGNNIAYENAGFFNLVAESNANIGNGQILSLAAFNFTAYPNQSMRFGGTHSTSPLADDTYLFNGDITATTLIKSGGTSDQILLADGTTTPLTGITGAYVDLTTDQLNIAGDKTFTDRLRVATHSEPWEATFVPNMQYLYDNYKPISETGTSGEDLVIGDVVYQSDGTFTWYKASASNLAHISSKLGYVVTAGLSGNTCGVSFDILHTTTGLTADSLIYVSTTAGAVTETPPTGAGNYVRVIGSNLSTTTRYFNSQSINYIEGDGSNINGVNIVGTIGGSVADTQLAFGSGANSIQGSNDLIWDSGQLKINGTNASGELLDINGTGVFQGIYFSGTNASNTGGMLYKDNAGTSRFSFQFTNNKVILSNRASSGTVEIRANSATSGGGGESTVLLAEYNLLTVTPDMTVTGAITGSNLSGTNTGDQDISGIATNAGNLTTHEGLTNNPHSVTQTQVGLSNVVNIDTTNATNITTGTLPTSVLPSLVITDTHVVASESAQLALTVQKGDIAVRTDENKTYIALNDTNVAMTDWQEMLTPTDAVTSVNSQTGIVSLTTTNIPEGSSLYYTEVRVSANSDVAANTAKATNVDTNLAFANRTTTQFEITASDGSDAVVTSATATLAGAMPSADKIKIDYITVTGAVNLDTLASNTHTHANQGILDGTAASFLTAQETKINFISITGAVDLDTLNTNSHTHTNKAILDATTASFLAAQNTKINFISVTQAVDLDTMESDIATNALKIGGSIVNNQIAVGALTADDIEGSASLTFNGTTLGVTGSINATVDIDGVDITASGNVAATGTIIATSTMSASNLSGTNTGDNAVNSLYSGLVSNVTHTGEVTGSTALTITADAVNDTHIDWGTGVNQVSTADIPEQTNLYYTEGRVSANTDVVNNTAKVTNVSTDLAWTASPTTGEVSSSDGTNATISLATGTNSGLLSPADFTLLGNTTGTNSGDNAANSLYSGLVSNVNTQLSVGSITATTFGITSDGGANDVILLEANTTQAGLLGASKWNEIVANTTAKHTHANTAALDLVSGTNTGDQTLTGLDYWNLTGGTTVTTPTITGAVTFVGNTIFTGDISPSGSINLDHTDDTTTGVIFKGASSWAHNFAHPTGDTAVPTGQNTFIGEIAGNFTMGSIATNVAFGSKNTGVGYDTLSSVIDGYENTAVGHSALSSVTDGGDNTGVGYGALDGTTTGTLNSGFGRWAGYGNVGGSYNTSLGAFALKAHTSGSHNVSIGAYSLTNLTTGNQNLAMGTDAGRYIANGSTNFITSGNNNMYFGFQTKASANSAGVTNENAIGYGTIGAGANTFTFGNTSVLNNYFTGHVHTSSVPTADTHLVNKLFVDNATAGASTFATFVTTSTNYTTNSKDSDSNKTIVLNTGVTTHTLDDSTTLTTGFRQQVLNKTGSSVSVTSSDTVIGSTGSLGDGLYAYYTLLSAGVWAVSIAGLNTGGDAYLADNQTFTGNNTFSNVIIASTAPTLGTHLTNKTYVDDNFEPDLGNPGTDNFVLASTIAGVRSWVASGTGTVTAVTGGTGLSSTGGTTPAISLDDTAVTPGSYTNSDLTIDAQGRVTAASNGSGAVVIHTKVDNVDVDSAAAEVVSQLAHATYDAVFFDYVIKSGTNVRAGRVVAAHDGTNVEYTVTATTDLGDCSDVTLSVDIDGANIRLMATVLTDNWSVKTITSGI